MSTTTTIDWSAIDTKDLSQYHVQRAIEDYVRARELTVLRSSLYAQKQAEKEATRQRVALRAKHCNALKRAGLFVKTEDSFRSSYKVDVDRTPSEDGWFGISWDRDPQRAVVQRSKVQLADELELKVEYKATYYSDLAELWYIRLK
jgi:hypothetical protein